MIGSSTADILPQNKAAGKRCPTGGLKEASPPKKFHTNVADISAKLVETVAGETS
jgi:hypothetical protein